MTWIALLLVVAFKVWLVSDEEILVEPWDAGEYARLSLNYFVQGDACTISRRPGAPIFIAAFRSLGIPYRPGLEIAYLAASALLAWRLGIAASSRFLGSAVFVLLAFHPWPFLGFGQLMAEPVACVFLFITMAQVMVLLGRERIRLSDPVVWTLGLSSVVWDLSRKETFIVLASYAAWMGLVSLRRSARAWGDTLKELSVMTLPIGLLLISHAAVKASNQRHCGVYTMSRMESPGFERLIGALYRIDADDAFLYAPVTRKSLGSAIAVSPTLQRFEADLLDPANPQTLAGVAVSQRPGEFGPWLNNLIFASFRGSPEEQETQMSQAADELDAALATGKLPERSGRYPLDPNYSLWLPNLVPSATRLLGELLRPPIWGPRFDPADPRAIDPILDATLFDLAATRRAALTSLHVVVYGQACSAVPIDWVRIESREGKVAAEVRPIPVGEETVRGGLPAESQPVEGQCILADLDARLDEPSGARLSFYADDQRLGVIEVEQLRDWSEERLNLVNGGQIQWMTRVVRRVVPRSDVTLAGRIKKRVSERYPAWALMGSVVALLLPGPRRAIGRRAVLAVLVLASAFVFRFAAISVLWATLGWTDPRFSQVMGPLFQIVVLLSGVLLAAAITRRAGRAADVAIRPGEPSAAPPPAPGS